MLIRRLSKKTKISMKSTRWTYKTNLKLLSRAELQPTVKMKLYLLRLMDFRKKIILLLVTSIRLTRS